MQSIHSAISNAGLSSSVRIRQNVPASELCTFSLGGNISALIEPSSLDELQEVLRVVKNENLPWKVLGAGSNVLVSDSGLDEIVIRLGRSFAKNSEPILDDIFRKGAYSIADELGESEKDKQQFRVFASQSLMSLSRTTVDAGLSGLEFAAGIPASLGGAIVMNAGAHGSSISKVVKNVYLLNENLELVSYSKDQMEYSYRRSRVQKTEIVIAADLELVAKDKEEIIRKRNSSLSYRKETQPLHLPSAGSVFKNPENKAAAELIEAVGLKGETFGGAKISEQHANWIVKDNHLAKASDVRYLIKLAQDRVIEEFGIDLETEIVQW